MHAPSTEIRNKAMETTVTLQTLLEWQANRDLVYQSKSSENSELKTVNRLQREGHS